MAGLPNDVNGCIPNFARIYNSMPVLEDGLSSGHASDTENNNPNTGNISMLMDQCKIVDAGQGTTATDKYIDSVLDSPALIAVKRNGTTTATATMGGACLVDAAVIVDTDNLTVVTDRGVGIGGGGLRKPTDNNLITTTTLPANSLVVNPVSPVANNASVAAAAAALNMAKRQAANNLNILTAMGAVVVNSSPQNTSPSSLVMMQPPPHEQQREKDIANQIIQNNLNNKHQHQQQQQNIKSNDIDLDTLYSISKYMILCYYTLYMDFM